MNPFIEPQTPPRSSKNRPQVHISDISCSTQETLFPQTPNKKEKSHLQTPSTLSHSKRVRNFLQTPSSVQKSNENFLASPDPTPYKSPRKTHRRRKSHVSEAEVGLFETPARDSSFGLFLPTPSTVGSGRKSGTARPHLKPPPVSIEAIAALNDNLHFEDDSDDATTTQYSDVFSLPPKQASFIFSSNLKAQPKMAYEPESPSKGHRKMPMTPRKQMIDDELINEWHGKSRNDTFIADEVEVNELRAQRKELTNPFVSVPGSSSRLTHVPKSDVDYSTHAEYINSRTGEKKVVELLERQRQIRPKKLDFSSV